MGLSKGGPFSGASGLWRDPAAGEEWRLTQLGHGGLSQWQPKCFDYHYGSVATSYLAAIPAAMQLRYLQTLTEIGAEQNSTVVFPMPIDIIKPFLELIEQPVRPVSANGARPSLVPAP